MIFNSHDISVCFWNHSKITHTNKHITYVQSLFNIVFVRVVPCRTADNVQSPHPPPPPPMKMNCVFWNRTFCESIIFLRPIKFVLNENQWCLERQRSMEFESLWLFLLFSLVFLNICNSFVFNLFYIIVMHFFCV